METAQKIGMRITSHGYYATTADWFDLLMQRYLPASVSELRATCQALGDEQGMEIDYSDLSTVTECLLVLAQLTGYAV